MRNIANLFQEFTNKNTEKHRIYLCRQHETQVLDEFGMTSIYDQNENHLLYSSGVGNILKSVIEFGPNETITIEEHMQK